MSGDDLRELNRYLRDRLLPLCVRRMGGLTLMRAVAAPTWLPVLIPALIFLAHARLFATWIVDDAGITFAYARSLSQGYGLVPQPGVPPVEGYSNFLWLVLFAPFFLLHHFDPVATPKLLSYLFVIASFALLRRLFRRFGDEYGGLTFVVLTLLALNTSFVAWTTSGLENPLYVFLLSLLLWLSVEAVAAKRITLRQGAAAGALAAAVAMTRPDGLLYFIAYPLALILAHIRTPRRPARSLAPNLLAYTLILALLLGGFLAFRLLYFGDWLPNTYYAKGGPFRAPLNGSPTGLGVSAGRLLDLLGSVAAPRSWNQSAPLGTTPVQSPLPPFLVLLLLCSMTAYLAFVRRLSRPHRTLLLFLALATAGYLLLPTDWMEEYRYATPFFVFLYAYIAVAFAETLRTIHLRPSARLIVAVLLALIALGFTRSVYAPRSLAFARNPTVPMDGVRDWLSGRFDYYADTLGVQRGSLLLPDLGGTLFYSKLRIYDLGMLCDKTIARTMGRHQQAFYNYIFEVAKPTFIHTHGSWSLRADLDRDPRFRDQYTPIEEHPDYWAGSVAGRLIYSGDYVRKDAVSGKEDALQEIQSGSDWGWSHGGRNQREGGADHRGGGPRRGRRPGWRTPDAESRPAEDPLEN